MGLDFPVHTKYGSDEDLVSIGGIEIMEGYPVLYTAIREDMYVLIADDKYFSDVNMECPEILTPAQFLDRYVDDKS